jgi:hypothetical protein
MQHLPLDVAAAAATDVTVSIVSGINKSNESSLKVPIQSPPELPIKQKYFLFLSFPH